MEIVIENETMNRSCPGDNEEEIHQQEATGCTVSANTKLLNDIGRRKNLSEWDLLLRTLHRKIVDMAKQSWP